MADEGDDSFKLKVVSCGDIIHSTMERRSRRIKGKVRKQLLKQLKFDSPSTIFNKKYLTATDDQFLSGNRDGIGRTVSPYKKISSETKKEQQNHPDVVMSLLLLQKEICNKKADRLGYIQRIQAFPFSIQCFTELGVRIYHNIGKSQALYFDATGTIVSMRNMTILYYSLVVQHPSSKEPPVPVAEMLSSEHSITAITFFLECFKREEAVVYGFHNVITPKKIVIDRSTVLLQSCLRVFNLETISDYVHRCFRIVNGSGNSKDFSKAPIHACVSHVMNSAKKMCRKLL